ncbi:MAG: acetyl-CoA carboxylase biotin carboxyl carrier protein subunit [Flavobacteriaceae bacterium]
MKGLIKPKDAHMTTYTITLGELEFILDKDDLKRFDIVPTADAGFHVLKDNKAYDVHVLHTDHHNKKMTVAVNGNRYSMKIEDSHDQMVKQMGLLSIASQKIKDVKAPMPGLIVDVLVKEGQEISEGTPLIVLSAMKMENILLAPADGTIKSVMVAKEDTVDKGQIIVEME